MILEPLSTSLLFEDSVFPRQKHIVHLSTSQPGWKFFMAFTISFLELRRHTSVVIHYALWKPRLVSVFWVLSQIFNIRFGALTDLSCILSLCHVSWYLGWNVNLHFGSGAALSYRLNWRWKHTTYNKYTVGGGICGYVNSRAVVHSSETHFGLCFFRLAT